MSLLQVIILSVVQGLTEFLPVSSSGHLVVISAFMTAIGSDPPQDLIEVSIVLHLGTLLAVLVFYRTEIIALLTNQRRAIPLLVVGTIPAAIVGVGIKKGLDQSSARLLLENPLLAGCMFLVTAAILRRAARRPHASGAYADLRWSQALHVGIYQAFAILPGISRSGATIGGGIEVGLQRGQAATFAFLLEIPAILGAGLLEFLDVLEEGGSGTSAAVLLVGFAVSFGVGLMALWAVIRFVERGRLALFMYYLVPLGVAVIIWQVASLAMNG